MNLLSITRRVASLVAVVALAACADGGADEAPDGKTTGIGVQGYQAGVTLAQYAALPDSVRLAPAADDSRGETQGVAVDVVIQLSGQRGASVPLDYTLHDARNNLAFVSRRIPIRPDTDRWERRGTVWLPVPSPGTYYVSVMLADSTGRETGGPRTRDFTIR